MRKVISAVLVSGLIFFGINSISFAAGPEKHECSHSQNQTAEVCTEPASIAMMGPMMGHGDHSGHSMHGDHAMQSDRSGHTDHGENSGQAAHQHGGVSKELTGAEMSPHIMPMAKSLTETMQVLGSRMERDMSPEAMMKWAEALDSISTQTLRMSDIMNNGKADEAEIHMIHQEIDNLLSRVKQ